MFTRASHNVHRNRLGVGLKCRFWLGGSPGRERGGPRLHFQPAPEGCKGCQSTLHPGIRWRPHPGCRLPVPGAWPPSPPPSSLTSFLLLLTPPPSSSSLLSAHLPPLLLPLSSPPPPQPPCTSESSFFTLNSDSRTAGTWLSWSGLDEEGHCPE